MTFDKQNLITPENPLASALLDALAEVVARRILARDFGKHTGEEDQDVGFVTEWPTLVEQARHDDISYTTSRRASNSPRGSNK